MSFANRLRELRLQNKLTQKEVADKIMVSRTTIGKYETSVAYPDFEKLVALSNLYNCSTDYLLCISDNPKRYSEIHLKFVDKVITLSVSEGIISKTTTDKDYDKLYEEIKTAYNTISLLKRLIVNDNTSK